MRTPFDDFDELEQPEYSKYRHKKRRTKSAFYTILFTFLFTLCAMVLVSQYQLMNECIKDIGTLQDELTSLEKQERMLEGRLEVKNGRIELDDKYFVSVADNALDTYHIHNNNDEIIEVFETPRGVLNTVHESFSEILHLLSESFDSLFH